MQCHDTEQTGKESNDVATNECLSTSNLRIVSLLPSATDIIHHLGLESYLVAVTHECVVSSKLLDSSVTIVTSDGVQADTSSQGDIHNKVARQLVSSDKQEEPLPSLYPVDYDKVHEALDITSKDEQLDDDSSCKRIVFTQDLCQVCAPSMEEVRRSMGPNQHDLTIVSLTPHTIQDVADNIVSVGKACGRHTAQQLLEAQTEFLGRFSQLEATVELHRCSSTPRPKAMVLEWLDPPFDGGHWIPELIQWAGLDSVVTKTAGTKSQSLTWQQVCETLPKNNPNEHGGEDDSIMIVVACCGLDLERNVADAQQIAAPRLSKHNSKVRVIAANGDEYFSKPGPQLVQGAILLALAGYASQPGVVEAIRKLPFVDPKILQAYQQVHLTANAPDGAAAESAVADIEDFVEVHNDACRSGQLSYTDPATGYMVMTELAHRKRGRCCGSGCRHCPYHHENVKDKTAKIQQPAILFAPPGEDDDDGPMVLRHGKIHVLFNSGGKDSFLALRALVRMAFRNDSGSARFGLALLTTFDSTSRRIAHQDVTIDDVVRQAEHLGVTLVGVPLHRQANKNESYVNRVRGGLDALEQHVRKRHGVEPGIEALAFGDLHLEHIIQWRDSQLSGWGYKLLYPLLNVPYDQLMRDLLTSKVPCVVSASNVDMVAVGQRFGTALCANLPASVDKFGENGEFHTLAQVWEVDRATALQLQHAVRSCDEPTVRWPSPTSPPKRS